jgi:hypothetical protein
MNYWDAKWMASMNENNVERDLEDRYMDDIRVVMMCLKAGWRWHEDGLYWCKEWEAEDESSEETTEDRSSRIILDTMNAIMGFLGFTKESPSDFEDKKTSNT